VIRALLILTALVAAAPARGDGDEARVRALAERLPVVDRELIANAKYAGHYSLSALAGFYNHDGRVWATFHLPPELVKQFADPAPLLVSLDGSPHLWTLQRRKSGSLDPVLSMITLTCYAPDEPGPFQRYTLASDGQNAVVSAVQLGGYLAWQQTLSMSQGERSLRLAWRLEADKWEPKKVDVIDMNQLPQRAPNLLEKYLTPVLRRLGPARAARRAVDPERRRQFASAQQAVSPGVRRTVQRCE
jgi:hypothetical protein